MWIKAFIQDLKLTPANPPNAGTNQLWWVTLSNHLPIWLYLCWGSSCTKYSTCESSWYITYSIYLAYLNMPVTMQQIMAHACSFALKQ